MAPLTKPSAPLAQTALPRVLLVDDEPGMIELVSDVLKRSRTCRLLTAPTLAAAENIIANERVDLLLADLNLPDGNGMELLPRLQQKHPEAAAVIITGTPSVNGAISAMRAGVVDFLPKPFTADHLIERVSTALAQQAKAAKRQVRLSRLRGAVKKLNVTRHTISKKVDLLCNDLVSAYGELSRQLDGVRLQEAFRKLMLGAADLEQMLCHAMDWILRHAGYSNVAIWLASEEEGFELGAYMKYTVPGEPELTRAMGAGLVPKINREGSVHLFNGEAREHLTAAEASMLKGQEILGVNCTYLGESLAVVVMFRDEKCPFTDEDVAMIRAISPIFALALANMVRQSQQDDEDADEPPSNDDTSIMDDDKPREKKERKPERKNDADWWKRGEPPPF
jgi:FixJ family two-component response regulator